jgi:hypothetical protein
MEIYEPPYFHQGQRPIIDSISGTGGPADQISYGGEFTIQYQVEAGATIASVALMRPCSSTHHTNTEQRRAPRIRDFRRKYARGAGHQRRDSGPSGLLYGVHR